MGSNRRANEMKDILEYRGFAGSVHYRAEDEVLYGKIEGVPDLVTFEGRSVKELKESFTKAVDQYLALCERLGKNPQKSYRGTFNVRISPELHLKAAEAAIRSNRSLNQFVEQAIENELTGSENVTAADSPKRYGPAGGGKKRKQAGMP